MLNADVPNVYVLLMFATSVRQSPPRNLVILKISDNKKADVDELKTHLIDEWAQFGQLIADAAISEWRHRLRIVCLCTPGILNINVIVTILK